MLGYKNLASGGLAIGLHSIVIFIKYREVSTLRYCQISSVIAETALYSRFGGHNGGVVKGEKRKRTFLI